MKTTPASDRPILSLLVGLVTLFALCTGSPGAPLLVYNNHDVGAGSLRQAIADNAALGGGNQVVFSNIVTGTITLASELMVSNNLVIVGPGEKVLALSGNEVTRVFRVQNAALDLSGLTIARAATNQGGGLFQSFGQLTLNRCTFSNNVVSSSGGALWIGTANAGITNCSFLANRATLGAEFDPRGGALVYAGGNLALVNCSFSQNTVSNGNGGAAVLGAATVTLLNCTVANNYAANGGGLYTESGATVALTNCTISANNGLNGAGIYNFGGVLRVRNTLLAGNTAGTGPDCSGTFISGGFNLIGKSDGSSGWGSLGDQVGTAASPINPLLGAFQNNGGQTLTMGPLAGSPALDQGGSGLTSDQRGLQRPYDSPLRVNASGGNGSDIGAVEIPGSVIYEWTFDRGNLAAALGPGTMTYADGATPALTSFGTTDGATIPHIGGRATAYMHVPAFTGLANGYLVDLTASYPNGGGQYLNQYTFIADVLLPANVNWMPFFNTNPLNQNDADFYVASNGSLGIGTYSAAGLIAANTWQRAAIVVDLTIPRLIYYLNGVPVGTNGSPVLDGRWALLSAADPGADLLLFNEGDLSGVYTHEVYVAHIGIADRPLSASEMLGVGGPSWEGIFARRLSVSRNGSSAVLNWRGGANVALQKTPNLDPAGWQTLNGTLGANTFSEPATNAAYYRLIGL